MKKLIYIYLIIFLFTSCECERDPIDAGVVSTVSGNAYDLENTIPVQNIKIKVAEYKFNFAIGTGGSDTFIRWIDSTYTNVNGDYNLSFTSSGLGDSYKLIADGTNTIRSFNSLIDITNIGGENVFDLHFLHLYPVNLVITVNNILDIPIRISCNYNYGLDDIDQSNGMFNRLLYLNKNIDNEVIFQIDTDLNNSYPDNSDLKQYRVAIPATNSTSVVDFPITLTDADFN